jgi:ABC-2 type transport system ATP-binding protein
VADGPISSLLARDGAVVRAERPAELAALLRTRGFEVESDDGALVVPGATPAQVGAVAASAGLALSDLRPLGRGLEDLFFSLTAA